MLTKTFLVAAASALTVSAHSWLECVDHDDSEIKQWMKGNASQGVMVDPT